MCFSVDKRHWPDLVLLQCFLWIRGTGLSLVLSQYLFVYKRYWPIVAVPTFRYIVSFSRYKSLAQTTVGGAYRLV